MPAVLLLKALLSTSNDKPQTCRTTLTKAEAPTELTDETREILFAVKYIHFSFFNFFLFY